MPQKLIQFGPEQGSAIRELADKFHRTESDIIRAGVALFQIATREVARGRALGIVSGDKVVSELFGVWSEATQPDQVGV